LGSLHGGGTIADRANDENSINKITYSQMNASLITVLLFFLVVWSEIEKKSVVALIMKKYNFIGDFPIFVKRWFVSNAKAV
jgi:hypothetical protein